MLSQQGTPRSCTSWHSPRQPDQRSTCGTVSAPELSTGCLVELDKFATRQVEKAGSLLEELIQAKLAGSLDRVANESRAPASDQTSCPALLGCDGEASANAPVLLVVDLHIALHNIHRV